MRLVFAGTPATALPALDRLLASGEHEVLAVVTRPDAPSGRGRRLTPSPVAERAAEAGVEVLKPAKVRDPEFLDRLRELAPDCCPVVAYGALLPQVALDIPVHGWVNLHFSLLPAWRGAAPVQRALLHGDEVTGATTFRIVKELDAGPVFGVVTETVRAEDTTGDLLGRLAESGAVLLEATLDGIASGDLEARPQPADGVTVAPKLNPEDARVTWSDPAAHVDRLIRACTPAPGPWTTFRGARLKLGPVRPVPPGEPGVGSDASGESGVGSDASGEPGVGSDASGESRAVHPGPGGPGGGHLAPGELRREKRGVLVGTGTGPVRLGEVQPQGKRAMAADDWMRGVQHADGDRLE